MHMTPLIKILIITTSHSTMGAGGEPTGVWLEELTTPYYAFADAGAQVTIVSINGGAVPVDPRSVLPAGQNDASVERYLKDDKLRATIRATARFTADMASGYDAVFLPGGHGTMWDYPQSPDIARVVVRFLEEGKPVAAVCHGPAGLVSARFGNGTPVVQGRRVAGFTNSEERAAGLETVVPFLLEDRLRELGGIYASGPDFKPFAVRDGNLITGQNPASATEVARLTLDAVRDARRDEAAE
jgi:putative intracellular protease/amidase